MKSAQKSPEFNPSPSSETIDATIVDSSIRLEIRKGEVVDVRTSMASVGVLSEKEAVGHEADGEGGTGHEANPGGGLGHEANPGGVFGHKTGGFQRMVETLKTKAGISIPRPDSSLEELMQVRQHLVTDRS
ncbi:MAG: hypothetical protein R2815_10185 [Flavobacteriales bacterium]